MICKIMKKEQTYPAFQNAVGTLFHLPYLVHLNSQTMTSYYILHVIVLSASRIKRGRQRDGRTTVKQYAPDLLMRGGGHKNEKTIH